MFSDIDNFATSYVCGVLGVVAFWNADTRYDYEIKNGIAVFTTTSSTAIFLNTDIPPIQLARKDGIMESFYIDDGDDKNRIFLITEHFDKKYLCKIPKGYESDVLYIFTPELLELIYRYNPWLVEMVDRQVVIHNKFATEDEQDYKNLAEMIQQLGGEFINNTNRYKDWRKPNKK